MTPPFDHHAPVGLNPLHAILLASMVPLFLGALLCDIAYARSYEIQWTNFASWLIAGGLVLCGLAGVWALVDLLRVDRRRARPWLFVALLIGTFVFGFVDSLIHAKDAWASMPGGLIASVIVAILAVLSTWLGFSHIRARTAA